MTVAFHLPARARSTDDHSIKLACDRRMREGRPRDEARLNGTGFASQGLATTTARAISGDNPEGRGAQRGTAARLGDLGCRGAKAGARAAAGMVYVLRRPASILRCPRMDGVASATWLGITRRCTHREQSQQCGSQVRPMIVRICQDAPRCIHGGPAVRLSNASVLQRMRVVER